MAAAGFVVALFAVVYLGVPLLRLGAKLTMMAPSLASLLWRVARSARREA